MKKWKKLINVCENIVNLEICGLKYKIYPRQENNLLLVRNTVVSIARNP